MHVYVCMCACVCVYVRTCLFAEMWLLSFTASPGSRSEASPQEVMRGNVAN